MSTRTALANGELLASFQIRDESVEHAQLSVPFSERFVRHRSGFACQDERFAATPEVAERLGLPPDRHSGLIVHAACDAQRGGCLVRQLQRFGRSPRIPHDSGQFGLRVGDFGGVRSQRLSPISKARRR